MEIVLTNWLTISVLSQVSLTVLRTLRSRLVGSNLSRPDLSLATAGQLDVMARTLVIL